MFIAIVCIAIGLAILLNTLGITTGSFWGFFWAIIFIAVGVKMLTKKSMCPFCSFWHGKVHNADCHCACHDKTEENR